MRKLPRISPRASGYDYSQLLRSGIADNVVNNQPVPDEQEKQCANGCPDETGALIEAIPTDCLTDEGRDESPDDSENRGQDKTFGIVWARGEPARNQAGNETDDDDPDDVGHEQPPALSFAIERIAQRTQVWNSDEMS
jgi:hypothetical protein